MDTAELYMHRCIELAQLGAGHVAPNPMVGAVLVHADRIIGEGYHQHYGQAHAEVNCIDSVMPGDAPLISESTLYVSLEPCAHHGKTPPCADLIIRHGIPKVVVGSRDPFVKVDGKGISKLEAAGVEVVTGVLEKECVKLNRSFFRMHQLQRPFIVLKWAQTADGFMGSLSDARLKISGALTDRLVHRWRSELASIMVGTTTARIDDPQLTNRLWNNVQPTRVVIDMGLKLPGNLKLFDGSVRTVVLNGLSDRHDGNTEWRRIVDNKPATIASALAGTGLNSVLIEGGRSLLTSFLAEGLWDEVRIITNKSMFVGSGIEAPGFPAGMVTNRSTIGTDEIVVIENPLYP